MNLSLTFQVHSSSNIAKSMTVQVEPQIYIYDFLLMLNCNIWSNSASLWDNIRFWHSRYKPSKSDWPWLCDVLRSTTVSWTPHIWFFYGLAVTYGLTRLLYEVKDFEIWLTSNKDFQIWLTSNMTFWGRSLPLSTCASGPSFKVTNCLIGPAVCDSFRNIVVRSPPELWRRLRTLIVTVAPFA